jgi:hypothetical protein
VSVALSQQCYGQKIHSRLATLPMQGGLRSASAKFVAVNLYFFIVVNVATFGVAEFFLNFDSD